VKAAGWGRPTDSLRARPLGNGAKIAAAITVTDMTHTVDPLSPVDVNLFDGIDAATLIEVTALARTRLLRAGDTLVAQGDAADSFFMLKAGSVALTQLNANGDVIVVRLLGPGDTLGGEAAFAGVHPVGAIAVTDASAYEWPGAVLAGLIERHGRLAANALRAASARVSELQEQHRQLATQKVERRIARALVRLVRHWGTRTEAGALINLPMSLEDLAAMAGTPLAAVSLALSQWESAGIIDASRPRMLIRTPYALTSIADELD
jgi:CRP-like cAMP-binding protein